MPTTPKAGGFTIASSPSGAAPRTPSVEPPYIELAVQESPDNAAAAWLWRPFDSILGSELQVRIGGSFVFPPTCHPTLAGIEKIVFVAGGVGINPLMSMLSYLAEGHAFSDLEEVVVLYSSKVSGRNLEDILFVRRIATLFSSGKIKGRFKLHLTGGSVGDLALKLSDYEIALGPYVEIQSGRFSALDLCRVVTANHSSSSMVYICGPPTMTDEMVTLLRSPKCEVHIDGSHIMTEKWW